MLTLALDKLNYDKEHIQYLGLAMLWIVDITYVEASRLPTNALSSTHTVSTAQFFLNFWTMHTGLEILRKLHDQYLKILFSRYLLCKLPDDIQGKHIAVDFTLDYLSFCWLLLPRETVGITSFVRGQYGTLQSPTTWLCLVHLKFVLKIQLNVRCLNVNLDDAVDVVVLSGLICVFFFSLVPVWYQY